MPTRPLIVAAGATLALAVAIRATDTEPAAEPAPEPSPQTEAPTQPPAPEPAEGPFDRLLLDHAAKYKEWKRVSETPRWVVTDCIATFPTLNSWLSKSDDETTHGGKLYHLFASNAGAYADVNRVISNLDPKQSEPVTIDLIPISKLALVKESWKPVEVVQAPNDLIATTEGDRQHFKYAPGTDGQWYKPGDQADIFIMTKLDPKTPNTDNGWVYGVVSSDGQRVLAAGAIESCMKCHVKAPVDRLFGLPWAQAERERREQLEAEKAAKPADDR